MPSGVEAQVMTEFVASDLPDSEHQAVRAWITVLEISREYIGSHAIRAAIPNTHRAYCLHRVHTTAHRDRKIADFRSTYSQLTGTVAAAAAAELAALAQNQSCPTYCWPLRRATSEVASRNASQ
jgi:hypothetical protein